VAKPAPAPKAAPAEPEEEAGIGTLSVTSSPLGADVYLDGANVGQTPIDIDIPTGKHRLKLIDASSKTEKLQTVRVRNGEVSKVDVAF
ncbi:MAG: PEGA domain-containing protein, partial [Myxococcales bacterium]